MKHFISFALARTHGSGPRTAQAPSVAHQGPGVSCEPGAGKNVNRGAGEEKDLPDLFTAQGGYFRGPVFCSSRLILSRSRAAIS